MILKSFEFQWDFDFQITTFKMIWILILNHLYLGDMILILKSSTYDDFAHLCLQLIFIQKTARRCTKASFFRTKYPILRELHSGIIYKYILIRAMIS